MSEEIVAMLKTMKKDALYFTPERMIVAKVGGHGMTLAFGAVGSLASMAMEKKKREQLAGLSPQSILGAHKKNHEIPYSEISSLELYIKLGTVRLKVSGSYEREFILGQKKMLQDSIDTLRPIFGDKLAVQT